VLSVAYNACSEIDLRKIKFCKFFFSFLSFSVKRPDGPILMSGQAQSCHTLF